MPIEVYPIKGSYSDRYVGKNRYEDRTPEEVAKEIKDRYQKIIDAGGQIVAGHELGHRQYSDNNMLTSYTYIVADMPEGYIETQPAKED